MNIFVTNECPVLCAKFLDTKRVNKMILETCQLLCSAVILNGGQAPYKLTHKGHPATKWAASSRGNYIWLLEHFKALADELYLRRGTKHKSYHEHYSVLVELYGLIPDGDRTEFVNCARNLSLNMDYTNRGSVFESYKAYLTDRWKGDKLTPVWT